MKKYTEKYKNHSKNIIVLTGHMGSGKTSIAKALAKSLGWRFYDSDFEIEKNRSKKSHLNSKRQCLKVESVENPIVISME